MRSEPFGDVILVPGEDAYGFADGDKVQAELHLSAEPDVIPDDAIFGRVGATFPNLTAKKKSRKMETGKNCHDSYHGRFWRSAMFGLCALAGCGYDHRLK